MTGSKPSLLNRFWTSKDAPTTPLLRQLVITLVLATTCFFTVKFILYLLNEDYGNLSLPMTASIFFLNFIFAFVLSLKKDSNKLELGLYFILSLLLSFFAQTLLLIIPLLALFSLTCFLLAGNRSTVLHYTCYLSFHLFYLVAFWTKISFSADEGFMILQFGLFIIYATFTFAQLALLRRIRPFAPAQVHDSPFVGLMKIGTLLLFVSALFWISYWNCLNLFSQDISAEDLAESAVFSKLDFDAGLAQYDHRRLSKQDLIDFLLTQEGGIGRAGSLFCLTQDHAWGSTFKKQLIREAKRGEFLTAGGSVKFWQFKVTERAYFYDRIKTIDDAIFSKQDCEIIEGWFEKINHYAYKITLADVAYAALFKQKPIGLYYNQDIGFAMLAVLSKILVARDKVLVEKNQRVLNEHAAGWVNNFRNTDDGIVYHHDVWVRNAYLLYKYAKYGTVVNAKLSIDWIKHQSPYQTGVHPAYNNHSVNTAPALGPLLIGIALTNDPTYRYLADNYLKYMIENNCYSTSYIGYDLWRDDVSSKQPEHESVFIKGTTGTDRQVKALRADKLALRKIVDNKELFILINLRSAGWHRYNGAGSVIFAQHGDAVILRDHYEQRKHEWLPKAKRVHSDKKITGRELNIVKKESSGIKRLFFHLYSFDPNLKYGNFGPFISDLIIDQHEARVQLDTDSHLSIEIEDNRLVIDYFLENKRTTVIDTLL
ncbi:MAG: hypothetical protein SWQ30_02860 [Thermodesulfobacteriota bacterium]|nr:hypothetical protein [Thermodesulfobacteriota bacterium]